MVKKKCQNCRSMIERVRARHLPYFALTPFMLTRLLSIGGMRVI